MKARIVLDCWQYEFKTVDPFAGFNNPETSLRFNEEFQSATAALLPASLASDQIKNFT